MRLFVDNLTNVDFSYLCPTRGLVGETWLAHIELTGELNAQGMICDFGIVKKELRNWLDTTLDHCLLVPTLDHNIETKESERTIETHLKQSDGKTMVWTRAPQQAITLMDVTSITPESAAQWCIRRLEGIFGEAVAQIHLSFTPEYIDGPSYHYSHGLKKHLGDCQRITHGHRSKLLIWRNDQLCQETMQNWARKWQDIYIATEEDCHFNKDGLLGFKYTAQQGDFELHLQEDRCYFIPTDTTVEHIASHIHETLSSQSPEESIRVKAFEGISKGAIVE